MNLEPTSKQEPTLAGCGDWATLGSLFGPFSHELRNELNIIALQARILSRLVPADRQSSVDVVNHAVRSASDLIEWMNRHRDRLEQLSGTIDLAAEIRSSLAPWTDSVLEEDPSAVSVELALPLSLEWTIRSPFEMSRWLRLAVREGLRLAREQGQTLAIALRVEQGRAELELRYPPGAPREPEPNRSEWTQRLLARSPSEPLHPIEQAQWDTLPQRQNLAVEGRLPSGRILLRIPSVKE